MKDTFRDRAVRILTFVILTAIVGGGALMMLPNYRNGRELRRQNAMLRAEIERKNAEIAQLVANQRRFETDPDFIEKIARENRRVFPGELVFSFENE